MKGGEESRDQVVQWSSGRKRSAGLGAPPLYLSLNVNLDLGPSVSYCNLRTGPTCPARQSADYIGLMAGLKLLAVGC